MDVNILEDREASLLGRREVRFSVKFEGATPSRKAVKEALHAKLGVDPSLVVIEKLSQPFGISQIEGSAMVYKDEKARGVEHAHLMRRDSGEKAEKKEKAAPAKGGKKK